MLVGVDGGAGSGTERRIQFKLPTPPEPAASKTIRMTWLPADSDTVFDTVVQACQPPVFGMVSGPVTSLPSNSTWKVPPTPFEATRASMTYAPEDWTLTEYLSH